MTIPYMGGQVASLLRQAKKQSGLLEDEDPLAGAPPAANPFQARSTSPMGDPNHAHRSGLLGTVQHALGTDRIAPELASLLTPEQAQRVRPGGLLGELGMTVLTGKGAQTRAQEEAMNLLGLQDMKVARDNATRLQSEFRRIRDTAAKMPMGQERSEYVARAMAEIIENPVNAMQTAVGLREREFAPQRETWTTVPMMVNGKQMMVMRSNMGQLLDPTTGTDLRESGAQLAPMPQQVSPNFTAVPGAVLPTGNTPILDTRTGRVSDPGISPNARPTVATARMQETYRKKSATLDNLNRAIDTYRAQLEQSGVEIMPGPARSRLTGAYANLKLLAKEAAELGALTGPDVKILEELFNDPASIRSGGMNLLEMGRRKQSLLEQLDQYRAIINGNRATLEENYNREMALSGPSTPDAPAGKTITVNGKTFRLP